MAAVVCGQYTTQIPDFRPASLTARRTSAVISTNSVRRSVRTSNAFMGFTPSGPWWYSRRDGTGGPTPRRSTALGERRGVSPPVWAGWRNRPMRWIVCVAALAMGGGSVAGQERPDELVKAAVFAAGGAETLSKYPAGRVIGKGTMSFSGVDTQFTCEQAYHIPGRFRTVVRCEVKGQK